MKWLKTPGFLLLTLLFFVFGCAKEKDFLPNEELESTLLTLRGTDNYRPFSATFDLSTSSVLVGPAGKCFADNMASINPIVEGDGQARHMGNTTAYFSHCLVPGAVPTPAFEGEGILTAANGDELYMTYSGVFFVSETTGYPEITFDFIISSGTGRFDDASGWGDALFTFSNPVIPPGGGLPIYSINGTLNGQIDY